MKQITCDLPQSRGAPSSMTRSGRGGRTRESHGCPAAVRAPRYSSGHRGSRTPRPRHKHRAVITGNLSGTLWNHKREIAGVITFASFGAEGRTTGNASASLMCQWNTYHPKQSVRIYHKSKETGDCLRAYVELVGGHGVEGFCDKRHREEVPSLPTVICTSFSR